jgi:hypothetical protein
VGAAERVSEVEGIARIADVEDGGARGDFDLAAPEQPLSGLEIDDRVRIRACARQIDEIEAFPLREIVELVCADLEGRAAPEASRGRDPGSGADVLVAELGRERMPLVVIGREGSTTETSSLRCAES